MFTTADTGTASCGTTVQFTAVNANTEPPFGLFCLVLKT